MITLKLMFFSKRNHYIKSLGIVYLLKYFISCCDAYLTRQTQQKFSDQNVHVWSLYLTLQVLITPLMCTTSGDV